MAEIDVHGYSVLEAKKIIEQTIVRLPKGETELRVIHGYHGGKDIQTMVRDPRQLRSKRIVRRKYTLNQGETILVLD
jgi:hypothetical protein